MNQSQTNEAGAETNEPGLSKLIVRALEPLNLESPAACLETFITPSDKFYVRNHFPMPQVSLDMWKLAIEGQVDNQIELSYEQISQLPAHTVTCTLECAGNSRIYLENAPGVQWSAGAIGTAKWPGVRLSEILKLAGLCPEAREVILQGADLGIPDDAPAPAEPIHFARSLTLAEAQAPDVLLAYKMNGEALTATHGFPLRAIVPGFYGMASVKWLSKIEVSATKFNGYYQTADYAYLQEATDRTAPTPIKNARVKSWLLSPLLDQVIPAGTRYRIHGAAWSGSADEIVKVEVSTDSGTSWSTAHLSGENISNCWRFFEYVWQTPNEPGPYTVMTRATDSAGNSQPFHHEENCGSYVIDFVIPVSVRVV